MYSIRCKCIQFIIQEQIDFMDAIPYLHACRSSRRRRRFQSDVVDLSICHQLQTAFSFSMFLLHRDIQAARASHRPLSSI